MDPVSELENAIGAELLRAAMLRAVQPTIGKRYILEKFLGRGASGLVVGARDTRLDRPIALKLRPAGDDATMLAEARALARLDHPNVVRVHDVDVVEATFDGRTFRLWMVSMQRVAGRTLRTWLAEEPRSHDDIIEVFLEAGRALEAAHAERIVHRDFKPDNVLVRTDGVAQVIDFGFAVPAVSSRSDRDLGFGVAGTDAYMSSESKKGRPSAKSDQYAFAISLVEALTGTPKKPGIFRPDTIPRETWRVVRRATRTSSARYPSMTALLRDLDTGRAPSLFWQRARRTVALMIGTIALGRWAAAHPQVVEDLAQSVERGVREALAPNTSTPATERSPFHTPPIPEPEGASPDPVVPLLPFRALEPRLEPAAAPLATLTQTAAATDPPCVPEPLRMRTHSDRNGLYGCYHLALSRENDGCPVSLRKQGSGPSPDCWAEQELEMPATADADAQRSLVVEGRHPDRVYRFVLPREGTSGRFSTDDGDEGTLELLPIEAPPTTP